MSGNRGFYINRFGEEIPDGGVDDSNTQLLDEKLDKFKNELRVDTQSAIKIFEEDLKRLAKNLDSAKKFQIDLNQRVKIKFEELETWKRNAGNTISEIYEKLNGIKPP